MKTFHSLSLSIGLLVLSATGLARAAEVPQGLFVYYGTAEFVNTNAGLTVGPYYNAFDCEQALDAAIDNAVSQGYQIESVKPCTGRWSFKGSLPELEAAPYTVAVLAGSPDESLGVAHALLDEVALARKTYRIDEYEAVLQAIAQSAITDPLRKKDRRDNK